MLQFWCEQALIEQGFSMRNQYNAPLLQLDPTTGKVQLAPMINGNPQNFAHIRKVHQTLHPRTWACLMMSELGRRITQAESFVSAEDSHICLVSCLSFFAALCYLINYFLWHSYSYLCLTVVFFLGGGMSLLVCAVHFFLRHRCQHCKNWSATEFLLTC